MFIKTVAMYGCTKSDIETKFATQFIDIKKALENTTHDRILQAKSRHRPDEFENKVTSWKAKHCWEELIEEFGWSHCKASVKNHDGRRFSLRMLGFISENVSCTFSTHRDYLNRWLYNSTPMAYKNALIELPVLILPTRGVYEGFFENRSMMREEFDRVIGELIELSPLSHSHPFVLLGVSIEDTEIEWLELESESGVNENKIIINRSIEFPPEFRQAGLGILNYFGEIIREKYPEENAKIKIEQDGPMVRMIIEAEDGSKKIIEKALEEYELVITGQQPPEFIFDDKIKILELKNELRIAETRIENQRDIIEYQREDMRELKQLFGKSLSSPELNLTVSPCINVSTTQSNALCFVNEIGDTLDDLQYLLEKGVGNPDILLRLNDLYESVEKVEQSADIETTKSSSGVKKLKKFIDEGADAGSKVNEFIESLSDGADTLKSLAKKYNSIAEWCGAPQVPKAIVD
jgi:hypothetical protein